MNRFELEIKYLRRTDKAAADLFQKYYDAINSVEVPENLDAIEFVNALGEWLQGKPLSPIMNEDEEWEKVAENENDILYRCIRRISLHKKEMRRTGDYLCTDINRLNIVDINGHKIESKPIIRMVNYIADLTSPIKFPYFGEKIDVYVEVFSYHGNVDDTLAVMYLNPEPGVEKKSIDEFERIKMFFKLKDEDMTLINQQEYMKRKSAWVVRTKGDKNAKL